MGTPFSGDDGLELILEGCSKLSNSRERKNGDALSLCGAAELLTKSGLVSSIHFLFKFTVSPQEGTAGVGKSLALQSARSQIDSKTNGVTTLVWAGDRKGDFKH